MKLIDNAKAAWRHYSTIALGILTGLGGAWASIPDSVKAALPGWVSQAVAWAIVAVAVFGLGGKFVDQTPKDAP